MSALDLKGRWLAQTVADGDTHVTPIGDALEHPMERGCWCRPLVMDERIVVHHSFDGRENSEPGGIPTNESQMVN